MRRILVMAAMVLVIAGVANGQTIKGSDYDFQWIGVGDTAYWTPQLGTTVVSVTMPSSRDPKWTIVTKSGDITLTCTTTAHIEVWYEQRKK